MRNFRVQDGTFGTYRATVSDWYWAAMGGIGIALVGLFQVWQPSTSASDIWCPIRNATGICCPGCGLTRGVAATARGDISAAFMFHPLAIVLVVESVVGWAWFGLARAGKVKPMRGVAIDRLIGAHAVLFAAIWVVRAATGTLPY